MRLKGRDSRIGVNSFTLGANPLIRPDPRLRLSDKEAVNGIIYGGVKKTPLAPGEINLVSIDMM